MPKKKKLASPARAPISMLAPSRVPTVRAPLSENFILLVPEASMPATEICCEMSEAGMMVWALDTP